MPRPAAPTKPTRLSPEEKARREVLFRPCRTRQDLKNWLWAFLGVDLPDCQVDPDSNSSPFEFVWETYNTVLGGGSEEVSQILGYSSRDGLKTFSVSIFETLVLFHCGLSLVHLAAIEKQSLKAQEYVRRHMEQPGLRDFADGEDNKRTRGIVRYEHEGNPFFNLTQTEFRLLPQKEQDFFRRVELKIEIAIATMTGVNSLHAPVFVLDEVDLIPNPAVYAEAKLIPGSIGDQLPLTVMISTRKSSFGFVQKEIDRANKSKLEIRHWNIIDVARPCPPKRHLPELPKIPIYVDESLLEAVGQSKFDSLRAEDKLKYKKLEGYVGCLQKCKIFAACKGRLATDQHSIARMLKPVPDVQAKFQNVGDVEVAKAQLLCQKPSSEGLVYPRLDRDLHVQTTADVFHRLTGRSRHLHPDITPEQLVGVLVEEFGAHVASGMDFGFSHNFAVPSAVVLKPWIIIFDGFEVAQLELEQHVALCKERILPWQPEVWPDPAYPSNIATFRRHKFKMRRWKKGPGSVMGGIQIVRAKLRPTNSEPEMLFLAESPGAMLVFEKLSRYHFTKDAAGNWTEIPSDEDDDTPDATRYLVMNEFPATNSGIKVVPEAEEEVERAPPPTPQDAARDRQRRYWEEVMGHVGMAGATPTTVKKGRFTMLT